MGAAEDLRHHDIRLELLVAYARSLRERGVQVPEITGHAHGGAIEAGDLTNPLVLDFFARL
ncbi:hypothetical protein [Streptosporangium sandarakinum]|uniref:hypothetical protein n=1 Tax=Streptosporangium sandarakinum TaxID=1260955 RepID=UPI003435B89A